MEFFASLLYLFLQIMLLLILLYVAKRVFVWITPVDDYALVRKHLLSSAGFSLAGYVGALLLVSGLAFHGESIGVINDFLQITFTLFAGTFLIALNRIFVNGMMLGGYRNLIDVHGEVNQNNLAIGIFQGLAFVAAGIQYFLANHNAELTLGQFMISIPLFILGQFLIVILHQLFIWKTTYDDLEELKKGNCAVAIHHGGLLITLSFLVGSAISFTDSLAFESVLGLLIYSTIGSLFLIYFPYLVAKPFLHLMVKPKHSIEQTIQSGHMDVALIYSLMRIMVAVLTIHTLPYGTLLW